MSAEIVTSACEQCSSIRLNARIADATLAGLSLHEGRLPLSSLAEVPDELASLDICCYFAAGRVYPPWHRRRPGPSVGRTNIVDRNGRRLIADWVLIVDGKTIKAVGEAGEVSMPSDARIDVLENVLGDRAVTGGVEGTDVETAAAATSSVSQGQLACS